MSTASKKTRRLVECAILIAVGTVLSTVKIIPMPLGGSVTLLSMLPVCLIGLRHGPRWGFGSAFVYAFLQLMLGIFSSGLLGWGLTPVSLAACMVLDYLAAYTVLGVTGLFRGGRVRMCGGIALGILLRLICHIASGTLIFASWCPEEFGDNYLLYSLLYNGAYILPEMIFTMAAVLVLSFLPATARILRGEDLAA